MPTIDVNGTTLYDERSGDGPAMLYVHATFGDADSWAGQGHRFGDRYTVVRYDRRGYLRGSPGTAPISYALQTDDTAALIEKLELAPCLIMRWSAGAAIDLEVALRHGQLLRGAVLSEPPMFSLDPAAGQALLGTVVPRVEQAIAAGGPRAAVDAFLSGHLCELLVDDRRGGQGRLPRERRGAWPTCRAPDARRHTRRRGRRGGAHARHRRKPKPSGHGSIARILAAALPDARFIELDGSGHVTHLEKPTSSPRPSRPRLIDTPRTPG
jgi:3-oxoadipate enol-lactonase